jgi:putative transposase
MEYENTLNREFHTEKQNEKWVTDITEFKVIHQPIYLSAIMGLFHNEIIVYQISIRNDIKLVEKTLKMAIKKEGRFPQ